MKAQAYVLISVKVGTARKVFQEMHDIPEVAEVNAVSGPYDIVARVDSFDTNTIGRLVMDKIQATYDHLSCHFDGELTSSRYSPSSNLSK